MTTISVSARTLFTGVLLLAAPVITQQPVKAAISSIIPLAWTPEHPADSSHRSSGKSVYRNSQNGTTTNISHEGKISFTADEKDIKSISPGGYFEYQKITFGNNRCIRIEGGSDGKLSRTFRVGGKEIAYEPEGRKFLADVLPDLLRNSTLGAEDRIARIYGKGGAKALLAEIKNIESDYVKSYYLCSLLRQPGFKESDLPEVLQSVSTLNSDYEKGRVLAAASKTMPDNEKAVREYVNVAATMGSDYEKGKALALVINNPKLGSASFGQAISAIGKMGSDYEKAKILMQAIENKNTSDANAKRLLDAATSINSDYEKSKVLIRFSNSHRLGGENLAQVLTASTGIHSDYEKSKVLIHLVSNHSLSTGQLVQCAGSASAINSDYEKSKVLQHIAHKKESDNAQVKDALRKAAKTINSEYEYGKVMKLID